MSQTIGKARLAFSRTWHFVDVANEQRTLGRLATSIAQTLQGKHKPVYNTGHDCGDYVVVVNADKLKFSGSKLKQKEYFVQSSQPGHSHHVPVKRVIENQGVSEVLRRTVAGMLPKNKLKRGRIARLKVFEGTEHPYKQNLVAYHDEAGVTVKN
ncbi:54S ribosomal protein L23 [Yarrowia sp. C11]|nr:54S ribosomal protein L23 [Yarrowia sp. E02]KAG5369427.1 54S ribosomal protein L23 [Yarrowia sp. C11]